MSGKHNSNGFIKTPSFNILKSRRFGDPKINNLETRYVITIIRTLDPDDIIDQILGQKHKEFIFFEQELADQFFTLIEQKLSLIRNNIKFFITLAEKFANSHGLYLCNISGHAIIPYETTFIYLKKHPIHESEEPEKFRYFRVEYCAHKGYQKYGNKALINDPDDVINTIWDNEDIEFIGNIPFCNKCSFKDSRFHAYCVSTSNVSAKNNGFIMLVFPHEGSLFQELAQYIMDNIMIPGPFVEIAEITLKDFNFYESNGAASCHWI